MNDTSVAEEIGFESSDLTSRATLLRAAARVFAREGFKGASVRLIAAEAGISNTLITYYFGNKENLWLNVVDMLFGHIEDLDASQRIDENGDLAAQFRQHLREKMSYSTQKVLLRRILAKEALTDSERYHNVLNKQMRELQETSTAYFARARELGLVRGLTAEEAHRFFHAYMAWWHTMPREVEMSINRKWDDPEAVEENLEFVHRILTTEA